MQNNLDLGQHFLINQDIINLMIEYSNIKKDEDILEIGAGNGVLSKEILKRCKKLQIVEIDEKLKIYLDAIEKNNKNVTIDYCNALDYNFKNHKKIITSLPYHIIEPFIKKCIMENVETIVMLIGDKFALSLNEKEKHSYLQTLTQSFFNCEVLDFVSNENFNPKPRTGSYIVRLTRKIEFDILSKIFSELFTQEDKKIKNALIEAIIRTFDKTQREAKAIIKNFEIDELILDSKLANLNNEKFNNLYLNLESNLKIVAE